MELASCLLARKNKIRFLGHGRRGFAAEALDDGGAGEVGWGDSMQIVGPLGNASEMYFYYDKSMNPAGEKAGNFWGDAELNPVDITLEPGFGFAIDNANGLTFNVVITCPYAL